MEGSSYSVYLASDASSGPGLGALNNLAYSNGAGGSLKSQHLFLLRCNCGAGDTFDGGFC